MEMQIGSVSLINGQWMRYLGGGRFEAAPAPGTADTMAKRFDTGGPLSGQPVGGNRAS